MPDLPTREQSKEEFRRCLAAVAANLQAILSAASLQELYRAIVAAEDNLVKAIAVLERENPQVTRKSEENDGVQAKRLQIHENTIGQWGIFVEGTTFPLILRDSREELAGALTKLMLQMFEHE
jgi:hypothetical protein